MYLNQVDGVDAETDFVKRLKAKQAAEVTAPLVKVGKVVSDKLEAIVRDVIQHTARPLQFRVRPKRRARPPL